MFPKVFFVRVVTSQNCVVKSKPCIKRYNFNLAKLKAFADVNLKVAKMAEFVPDIVENNAGKGENAGTSIFSFTHIVFKKLPFQGSLKPVTLW